MHITGQLTSIFSEWQARQPFQQPEIASSNALCQLQYNRQTSQDLCNSKPVKVSLRACAASSEVR